MKIYTVVNIRGRTRKVKAEEVKELPGKQGAILHFYKGGKHFSTARDIEYWEEEEWKPHEPPPRMQIDVP